MHKVIANARDAFASPPTIFLSAVRKLIELLIESPETGGARWHPLGFVHLALSDSSEVKLRLHIWPKHCRRTQVPYWPIHDHMFTLSSRVITGSVTNKMYAVTPNLLGNHKAYQVGYEGGTSVLTSTDRLVEATLTETNVYTRGGEYVVPKGKYHTSDISEDSFSSTFVIGTEISSQIPHVLGEVHGANRYEYERTVCNVADLQLMLRMLLAGI